MVSRRKHGAMTPRTAEELETREICWPYIYHPGRLDCFEYIDAEEHRSELARCAEDALNYYNKRRGTNYKYMEPLKMSCSVEDVYRIHCNFTAKPDNHPPKKGDLTVKFFAEVEEDVGDHFKVNCCRVVNGRTSKIGCPMCPGIIEHPPSLPLHKRVKRVWYVESSDDSSGEDNGPDHKVKSTESVPGKIDGTNDKNLSPEKFDSCNKTRDRQSDSFTINWGATPWDQIYQCAGKALALYNSKSGTDYQYMEPVDISYSATWDRLWIFCRFTAKFESPSHKDGGSPIKVFFAELGGNGNGEVFVTSCDVLSSLAYPGNWFTPQTASASQYHQASGNLFTPQTASAPQYHQAPGSWFTPQTASASQYHQASGNLFTPQTTSAPQYHQAPGSWFTPQTTSAPQYHQARSVRARSV